MDDAAWTRITRAVINEVFTELEEPTMDMVTAGCDRGREAGYTDVVGVWKAMLAAKRREVEGP